jgi:hypothetical protein
MFLESRRIANAFGIASILLSLGYWVYMYIPTDWPHEGRFEVSLVGLVTILCSALVTALIAGLRGSRWWFLAAAGPICGAMFLLSLRT